MKVYNKKIIADGKKLISIKNGEGGISRLCPLPRKNAYEKRLVRFFNTSLLKHFYIWFLGNLERLGRLAIFTKFTKLFMFSKSCLKIAYDEIIFVRYAVAESGA